MQRHLISFINPFNYVKRLEVRQTNGNVSELSMISPRMEDLSESSVIYSDKYEFTEVLPDVCAFM
jgi:hypothetical protein